MFRSPRQGKSIRALIGRALEQLEAREVPAVVGIIPGSPATGLNGSTSESFVSDNGQYVVFATAGTNVTGTTDANGTATDIYLTDRNNPNPATATVLISRAGAATTTTANNGSFSPRISGDGNYVVFQSDATNLVAGVTDTNAMTDVFLYDRQMNTIALVSRSLGSATTTGTAAAVEAVISKDGRYVAYTSFATNPNVVGFVDGNGAANSDVFLFDRTAPTATATTLVSRSTAAGGLTSGQNLSERPSISDDGTVVAYESGANDLVAGVMDTNNDLDVFAFNRTGTGTTSLISVSTTASTTGNQASFNPQVSGDGTAVAFNTIATNLVATDANGTTDVFVSAATGGTPTLVSRQAGLATTTATGESSYDRSLQGVRQRVISTTGTTVVYTSTATNLVAGQVDTAGTNDVFVFNRTTGVTTLLSAAATSAVTAGTGASSNGAISSDGSTVVFQSDANNLVAGQTDNNGGSDVFAANATGAPAVRLVSNSTTGASTTGNGPSIFPQLSTDGAIITFISSATDVLAGATAGGQQTFVATTPPAPPAPPSLESFVSEDGRYVVFTTATTVAGFTDANTGTDIYLVDRNPGGTTTLVSRQAGSTTTTANADSFSPRISADGRFVVYQSVSTNLVAGQVDGANTTDVFLFDRQAGTTTLVSRTAAAPATTGNDASVEAVLSANGQYVAFTSFATNLVTGFTDGNAGGSDVFLFNVGTGAITLVSASTTAGTSGNVLSERPSISDDGNIVAYESGATNLLNGVTDTNNDLDVFAFNRTAGTTALVSVSTTANTTGNAFSFNPQVSGNGSVVAFISAATNIAGSDTNGATDVFTAPAAGGTVTLISRSAGSATTTSNGESSYDRSAAGVRQKVLSADGGVVVFTSTGNNLANGQIDGNPAPGATDVFAFVRNAGTVTLLSVSTTANTSGNGSSSNGTVSSDGSVVAFQSDATNLVAGTDGNNGSDVFVSNPAAPAPRLVSATVAGGTTTANAPSFFPQLSGNGTTNTFISTATNLPAGTAVVGAASGNQQTFVAATPGVVVPPVVASLDSFVSDNGRYVVYTTAASNVAGITDTNGGTDIFLFDRVAATTTLVSRTGAAATTTGNGAAFSPRISADGRYVAFQSDATNLVSGQTDTNNATDVFLFDRTTGAVTLVSRSATTTTGNDASVEAVLSANGLFVAFTSFATNLVGGFADGNGGGSDVFVYDVMTGAVTLVSRSTTAGTSGNGLSEQPSISNDGGVIAYETGATNLLAGITDNNNDLDVYAFARTAGTTTLVSRSAGAATTTGNGFSFNPQVSGSGNAVAFISAATDLVAGQADANGATDVFVSVGGATTLVSRAAGVAATTANGESFYDRSAAGVRQKVISTDGSVVVFTSTATNLVTGQADTNGATDVFAFNRTAGTSTLLSRTAASAATAGNGASSNGTISSNGSTIAFQSDATNLVTGQTDANAGSDVFVSNLSNPVPRLLSSATTGVTTTGNGAAFFPQLSADGTVSTFISTANNLAATAIPRSSSGTQQTFVSVASVLPAPTGTNVGAGAGGVAVLLGTNGAAVASQVSPFPGYTGAVRTATGDVNGDGIADLIYGKGPGAPSDVLVLDGANGARIAAFAAFEPTFLGGVYVTAGDINLDGRAEVVVTPDVSGGPRVVVYDGARLTAGDTTSGIVSFFGIDDANFRGGARAAVGDMNGDAIPDVAVAAGFLGGPRVTIYSGANVLTSARTVLANFFVFEQTFRNGAFVSVGDVNGDGIGDLVAGAGPGGGPRVRVLDGRALILGGGTQTELASFFTSANAATFRGGVSVTTRNLDGDNLADIVTGTGPGDQGRVIGFTGRAIQASGSTPATAFNVAPFGDAFNAGIFVG